MPQMAPISWLTLFIMFTSIFMLFNIMNYFSVLPNSPKTSHSKKYSINQTYWKW